MSVHVAIIALDLCGSPKRVNLATNTTLREASVHKKWLLIASIFLFSGQAHAETWKTSLELDKAKSSGGCDATLGSMSFDVTGSAVKVSNENGTLLNGQAGPDGTLKQEIKSASGRRGVLSGNVKTREFKLTLADGTCTWNLVPQK